MALSHTFYLSLLLFGSLFSSPTAEYIGQALVNYAGAGLQYIEQDDTINYRRVTASMRGVPRCSGLVTRLSLGRTISNTRYHDISFIFHSHGNAVCAQIATYNTTRAVETLMEDDFFSQCGEPPADPWTDLTAVTIEWGPDYTAWRLNGIDFARYTKPVSSPEDPYRQFHSIYITVHHTNNETAHGPVHTSCPASGVFVEKVDITSYSNTFFDDSTLITRQLGSSTPDHTDYTTWGQSRFWSLLSRFPLQHRDEMLLQNNVHILENGVELYQTRLNPFYDPNSVLEQQITAMNGFMQDTASTTFRDPNPWTPSTLSESVATWWYDPFLNELNVEERGGLTFTITSTGVEKRSVRMSQTFRNFFFETDFLNNKASDEYWNHLEYCLHLEIRTTWARNIEVSLFPQGKETAADKNQFFGTWVLELTNPDTIQTYSRCFTVNRDLSSETTLELEILMGAIDGIALVEHFITFTSIRFYQVRGNTASQEDWGATVLARTDFDPGFWRRLYFETFATPSSSGTFTWELIQQPPLPQNLTLLYDIVLYSLVKDQTYQVSFSGRLERNALTSPEDRNGIDGRIAQFFLTAEDTNGPRDFCGTILGKLTETSRTFDCYFKSPETLLTAASVGRGKATLLTGGADYGSSAYDIVLESVFIRSWESGEPVPTLPTIPEKPAIGDRTDKFTTPEPIAITPVPTPSQVITPPTTDSPAPLVPQRFLDQRTLRDLYAEIYQNNIYMLEFEDTSVEEIDLAGFRQHVGGNMREVCLFMGFDTNFCDIDENNVEVIELCYSNLKLPTQNVAVRGGDPRSCRGIGSAVVYSYQSERDVNTTGVESYLLFTMAGLDEALHLDDRYENNVLARLNDDISRGNIVVRPKGVAFLIPPPPPPQPTPSPPEGDHGLKNLWWIIFVLIAAFIGLAIGFNAWYQHRLRKLQRAAVVRELFKDDLSPDYMPTIMSGMGMLQLEQLGNLKRQFDAMDADEGGTLDKKEIRDVLQLLKVNVTEEEFVHFFNSIDEDGNEEIEFTEFAVGFIPFLVRQVRALSEGSADNDTEKIFLALAGEKKLSSIFETKLLDEDKSEQLMRKTPFLERHGANVVKNMAESHQEKKLMKQAEQEEEREIVVGDKVMVRDNIARFEELNAYLRNYMPAEDLPESYHDVDTVVGIVIKTQRFDEALCYQVDFPAKDAAYWFHHSAVERKKATNMDHYLTRDERMKAQRMERYMVIRAVIAGLVSSALTAGAEMLADHYFTDESASEGFFSTSIGAGKEPEYWVVLISASIVFAVLEILYLYWDALRTTMKVSCVFGLVLYPLDEERKFYCNALARCSLELGNPVHKMWSINPTRNKSEIAKALAELAYKAKSGVSSFFLRLTFKRLLTRIGAKAAQAWIACPVVMLANGLVARLVLDKSRVTALAPRLIYRMLEHTGEGEPPPWNLASVWVTVEHFEKLRVNILRAIGCVVVARGEWHPSLEVLYKTARRKLGWHNEGKQTLKKASDEDDDAMSHEPDASANEEDETAPLNEQEEEEVWDELRLMKMIRMDCCVTHNMDVVETLIHALRLDAHADALLADQIIDSSSCSGSDDDFDILSSEDSSCFDTKHQIAFDQNEKCLILKFLVLAIIVSGKPTRACLNLAGRCFQAAGGDITARPAKTIKSLYHLFYRGHIHAVCKNFDLIFKAHRTMKGDHRSLGSRVLSVMVDAVDW